MYPYWVERPDLSIEAQSILNHGDITVFEDATHSCFHIMLGNDEWTSVLMPWSEAAREILKRRAYIMHNDLSDSENKWANEERGRNIASGEKEQADLLGDIAQSIADWGGRGRDFYVSPGGIDDTK